MYIPLTLKSTTRETARRLAGLRKQILDMTLDRWGLPSGEGPAYIGGVEIEVPPLLSSKEMESAFKESTELQKRIDLYPLGGDMLVFSFLTSINKPRNDWHVDLTKQDCLFVHDAIARTIALLEASPRKESALGVGHAYDIDVKKLPVWRDKATEYGFREVTSLSMKCLSSTRHAVKSILDGWTNETCVWVER